jgi:hypothetical protein
MLFSLVLLASMTTDQICPAEIHTQQSASAPPGWESVRGPARHDLAGLVLYSGHPDKKYEVPPERLKSTGYYQNLRYEFPKQAKQMWIECAYSSTAMVMRKRLDGALRSCDAVIGPGYGRVKSITCR